MNPNNIPNQKSFLANNSSIKMEEKLNLLQKENLSLKAQLQSFLEKEKLYNSNIQKIKLMQSEQAEQFNNFKKDMFQRNEELKKKFFDSEKALEEQYLQSISGFNEQINQMSKEISNRNEIINNLKNELNGMQEKIAQEELNFNLKEKEFENVLQIKERKL